MLARTLLEKFKKSLRFHQERPLSIVPVERLVPLRDLYPGVPEPEPLSTPLMFAARWVGGEIHGEDTPALAADLLEAGFDSPALRRLAAETEARCNADVAPLVEALIRELIPDAHLSEYRARLLITRRVARQVISGGRDADSAVSFLEFQIWNRESTCDDVSRLFDLADEMYWDPEYQRFKPVIENDTLDTLARLAQLTDEQIFAA